MRPVRRRLLDAEHRAGQELGITPSATLTTSLAVVHTVPFDDELVNLGTQQAVTMNSD